MNKILIFYGGDAAIEIISYIFDANLSDGNDEFIIFDEFLSKHKFNLFKKNLKKISLINKLSYFKNIKVNKTFIASGIPKLRNAAYKVLKKNGFKLSTLIHPTSYVSKTATISEGSILAPFTLVAPYAFVGKNCFLNSYSSVGHHSKIGNSNVLSPYSTINGNCKIGNNNLLGTGTIINPGINMKNNCKISSSTVLRKNISSNFLVHGNPVIIRKIY